MFFKPNFHLKSYLRALIALGLFCWLVLGNPGTAWAARTGGRIGGGSFRAPSRSYSAPRGGSYRGGGYRTTPGYGYGGGFGFPFLLPFFGYGGGGLFSILIFIAITGFIVRSFQSAGLGGASGYEASPKVAVAQVQVGLLANAQELQPELNRLALSADTSSATGRAQVLQEATLALLRHPEYWVYGASTTQKANLDAAEAKFNQLALTERSKFTDETLSNVGSVINDKTPDALTGDSDSSEESDLGEYIIATVIVGATGSLNLPQINDTDSLRQALQQIGSLGSDRLLAVEVLWTPQATGDTLTSDDILAYYPSLKLV